MTYTYVLYIIYMKHNIYIYIYIYIYVYIYKNHCTHMITSRKFQLKQTWLLKKGIAEMKLDTEKTMKLE